MASMACEVMPLQRYVSGRLRGEPAVPNEWLCEGGTEGSA